jgi:mRNA interferase RelE/StbE
LAWEIRIEPAVRKQIRKLGKVNYARVIAGLEEIAELENPKQRGRALSGKLAGLWRWRFGDYRAIARIEEQRVVIVVIAVGHRREVYD